MDDDTAMLGPGSSSASTSVANFVWLVSFDLSGTTHLQPNQYMGDRISAWKRSIGRPIAIDKRISLVTAIFSDRRVAEAVKRLSRDDVQAFVDVVDEVVPILPSKRKWLTNLNSKFPLVPSRH